MNADPAPQIAEDPNLAAEQAQAQRSLISNLQTEAQIDTTNILTRYGTMQALAGSGMTGASGTGATAPPIRF